MKTFLIIVLLSVIVIENFFLASKHSRNRQSSSLSMFISLELKRKHSFHYFQRF